MKPIVEKLSVFEHFQSVRQRLLNNGHGRAVQFVEGVKDASRDKFVLLSRDFFPKGCPESFPLLLHVQLLHVQL